MSDVAIVVPVMQRPQAAARFMMSLRKTSDAPVYAVAEEHDTETVKAWLAHGAQVLFSDGPSYPVKVNLAYHKTGEPWLFICGDDVKFWPQWLDRALGCAERTGGKVIGTNDLSTPAVMRGEHVTHPLISRQYVDEVGASWDGPGVVCHEGYRHNFVDNEISRRARQLGVHVHAADSWVEHLHPVFDKAPDDPVYRLGRESADADAALYLERARANGAR